MIESNKDQHLDNEIAAFTDQLLNGETSASLAATSESQELRQLQETIILLKQAVDADQPQADFAKHLRQELAAQWRRQQNGQQRGLLDKVRDGLRALENPRTAGSAALVAALVLMMIVLVFTSPAVSEPLEGTALGDSALLPIVLVIGAFVIGVIAWSIWRKKD